MKRRRRANVTSPEPQKFTRAKEDITNIVKRGFTEIAYASPDQIARDILDIVQKNFAPPRPVAQDLAAVSDETYEKFEHRVIVQRPITRQLVRAMQHRVKKLFFWSAKDMADYLNVDRSTLKKIESGTRAPSQEFERRFRHLETHVAAWSYENRERNQQVIIVESEYPMPRRYRIRRKLKACKRCKKYFEPTRGNNIYCHTKECETRKKKRRRKKK